MMQNNQLCRNILIIEDDEGIRETFQLILECEGYQVFTAMDGQQGIDLLSCIPKPCLILLDMMMPVMNGWEFLEKKDHDEKLSRIPVVVVSALGDKPISAKAQKFMKKPIDYEALLYEVKAWCGTELEK